jgi:ribonucleoside-diphosphate reductase alpha chain
MNVSVTKRDGTKQSYNADKINMALEEASRGLDDQISKVVQVATEVSFTLFDGITTEQLDEALIQTALQNVKDDPDFDTIVFRIMYEKVSNLIYWMRA